MDIVIKRGEIIPREQRDKVSQRYHRITRAINDEFWGIISEVDHSFYVGSYGRGTAIDTSDIDILVELPRDVYERHDIQRGNGQSRLLQAVRSALLATYPNSNVHADGQVVVIDFSDGIKFEILPAFKHIDYLGRWNGKYDYADSNMGGNWLTTDPKAEQDAMLVKNRESNGLLFDTCKHMRAIRDTYFENYKLPGIVIDSFVYHYMGGWHWLREGEASSNHPRGAYEKRLYYDCPSYGFTLYAPGSGMPVKTYDCVDGLKIVLDYMSKE